MKKTIILISIHLLILRPTISVLAQTIDFRNNYTGGDWVSFYVDAPNRDVYNGNKFPNQPHTTFNYIPTAKKIALVSYLLKTDTLSLYRYSIIVNNEPKKVNQSFVGRPIKEKMLDEKFNNVDLGVYDIANKNLIMLLYKINRPDKIFKTIYCAKTNNPAKIAYFSKTAFDNNNNEYTTLNKDRNKISLSKSNSTLNIVKDKSDFDFLYNIAIKERVSGKVIFRSAAWEYDYYTEREELSPYVKVDKNIFKKSGEYEIIIQPLIKWNLPMKEKEKYITRHTISITLDEENFTKKEFFTYLGYSGALLGVIIGLIGVYIKRRNTKKILGEQQQKEISKLKLEVVKSQLNPHFLFNALAGIQNLMNKNDTENANKYLSKFARLTRNVLESKELISLTEEKTLLDDYLQMEQLRFGFQYTINTQADLDTENIEIPAMLLQPFVENAVKHGIAEKGKDGEIAVSFEKQVSDLVLKITDNGSGFDTTQTYDGLGLALSKNRISLLNTVYKDTPFILNIQSDTNGTMITITLSQWL
jgi:sensor histidine kinase YesM